MNNNKPIYSDIEVLYWSGTGNSYRVAEWVRELAEHRNISTRLCSLDTSITSQNDKHPSLTIIVTPTHGFTAPWHVLKKTWQLRAGNGNHAMCLATRAGLKFGSFYLPGISASTTFLFSLLLLIRGYKVRGAASVDMPSNWFSLHPIQKFESQKKIIKRGKNKINRPVTKVLDGRVNWFTLNILYESVLGILLLPISFAYIFVGRFFLAKLFFANNRCDGCGLCSKYCSVNAKMYGRATPRPYWTYRCESCMRCAAFCPQNAIEAGNSWGVILYFISSIPVSGYLVSWIKQYVLPIPVGSERVLSVAFDLLYYFPAIMVSYLFFYLLIRINLVNVFFTNSTFTHLAFWGRYREPKINPKKLIK